MCDIKRCGSEQGNIAAATPKRKRKHLINDVVINLEPSEIYLSNGKHTSI